MFVVLLLIVPTQLHRMRDAEFLLSGLRISDMGGLIWKVFIELLKKYIKPGARELFHKMMI